METIFISGREAVEEAERLIELHGEGAGLQAAMLAERSRGNDNVVRFCHWRQIERLIDAMESVQPTGSIH